MLNDAVGRRTPRSLAGALVLYSLRKQPLTQELIEICEDWIPNCDNWTLFHATLTCRALQNVRRTRIHERLGQAIPSFGKGTTSDWAKLASCLEDERPEIWDQCCDRLHDASEETMLTMLLSMQGVLEVQQSFEYQDLRDTFRRQNRDVPV